MYSFPIGAIVDSFRLPLKEAIAKAASVGASGLQMYAVRGETAPEVLVGEKRRELKKYVEDCGLVFSAICGDQGHGFGDPALNPQLVERSKRIMDLALELGTDIVTTHIGVVPTDPAHPRYAIMQEACGELAEYADSVHAHFALETGPETSAVLRAFLDSLHSTGVAVNMDPANMVMVSGEDPVIAVRTLAPYIVHTHAKDGVKLIDADPELIYGLTPMPEDMKNIRFFKEVPLGEGGVDFPAYLRALDEIGFKGYLTIEREVGDDPAGDIARAVQFLKKTISEG